MTQIFVSRAELMADGETTQEHATSQDEEAGIVERDKLNQDPRTGGLFRGCFKPIVPMPFHGVIHDQEDGVTRCPVCAWELEDGYCNSCQMNYDSDMDGYSEDDDDDADLDVSSDIDLLSFDEEDPSDGEDADRLARENGRIRDLTVNQADDISLDGDGFGLHTPRYNGDFHIPRTAAQGLIGHPARRVDQAASAANLLRYTPSALADVTTTQLPGFSDIDVDIDEEDDDEDEDEEEDEEEEDDEADTSLDGFVVGDELDDEEAQPSEFDTDDTIHNHADQVRNSSEGETYWVDDSASDHPNRSYNSPKVGTYTDDDGSDHPSCSYASPNLGTYTDDAASDHPSRSQESPKLGTYANSSDSTDTEAPVQSQRTRKRRRIVQEASTDEESDSENDSERSRPRRKLSSSGSATIGRQSPVLGSSSTATEKTSRRPRGRDLVPAAGFGGNGTEYGYDLPSPEILDRQLASRPRRTDDRGHSNAAHRQHSDPYPYSRSSSRRPYYSSDTSMIYTGSNHFPRTHSDVHLRPAPLTIRRARARRHNRAV